MIRRLTGLILLAATAAISAAVWWVSLGQALDQLERRGQSDLALAADRLVGQLQGYRELLVALAGDPRFAESELDTADLNQILRRSADLTGALDMVLLDKDRKPRASASDESVSGWLDAPFIDRALTGALGNFHAVSEAFGRRCFFFAAPIFSERGPVSGVLVTVVDLERIEAVGRGARPAVMFTDKLGVTFSSNRSELVLMQRGNGLAHITAQYSEEDLRPFVGYQADMLQEHTLWRLEAGPYVPNRALYLARDIPVIDMTAEALIDVRPAYVAAGLQATIVAAVLLFFGALLMLATERRRVLAIANAELEHRVKERTQELSDTNAALRLEVRERQDAELALKRAQDELVQFGKLSALGHMSAGISHELNQPLMAIQSFSENGEQFIELGKVSKAKENLAKISDLAGRMARIIRNLKAFARQESEPSGRVDLCSAARASVEVTESTLHREGVELSLSLPDDPVWVDGGEVRLQQVIVNLITNAIDAMADGGEKALHVTVQGGAEPSVIVRDTGPGIADPDKIFEPFYSTKTVGAGEGTGLGLSISYGLVQSFGGNIIGENAPGCGAIFTVKLKPWTEEKAA